MVTPFVKTVRKEFTGSPFDRIYSKVQDEIKQQIMSDRGPITVDQIRVSPLDVAPVIPQPSSSSIRDMGRRLGFAEAHALLSTREFRIEKKESTEIITPTREKRKKVWLPKMPNISPTTRTKPSKMSAKQLQPVLEASKDPEAIDEEDQPRAPPVRVVLAPPTKETAVREPLPSSAPIVRRNEATRDRPVASQQPKANVTYPPNQSVTRRFIGKPPTVSVTLDKDAIDAVRTSPVVHGRGYQEHDETRELEQLVHDTHKMLVKDGVFDLDNFEKDLSDLEAQGNPDWSDIEAAIESLHRDLAL